MWEMRYLRWQNDVDSKEFCTHKKEPDGIAIMRAYWEGLKAQKVGEMQWGWKTSTGAPTKGRWVGGGYTTSFPALMNPCT